MTKPPGMLLTGSSGLIGFEGGIHFAEQGWGAHGVDNHMRATFLGPSGDTRWNQRRLHPQSKGFVHHELHLRDPEGALNLVGSVKPDAIIDTAAQPSHDLAAKVPFDDFDTNAVGTLNLHEAARRHAKGAPILRMSTNDFYGLRLRSPAN